LYFSKNDDEKKKGGKKSEPKIEKKELEYFPSEESEASEYLEEIEIETSEDMYERLNKINIKAVKKVDQKSSKVSLSKPNETPN